MWDIICDIRGKKRQRGQLCLYANFYVYVHPISGKISLLCGITHTLNLIIISPYHTKQNFCIPQQQWLVDSKSGNKGMILYYSKKHFYISRSYVTNLGVFSPIHSLYFFTPLLHFVMLCTLIIKYCNYISPYCKSNIATSVYSVHAAPIACVSVLEVKWKIV